MQSTMQDVLLTVAAILRFCEFRARRPRTVTTATGDGYRHATYREVGRQAAQPPTRCAGSVSRATTGSRPSCGTTRNTWRPTSRCRRWVRCCTLNIRLFPEAGSVRRPRGRGPVVIVILTGADPQRRCAQDGDRAHRVAVGAGDLRTVPAVRQRTWCATTTSPPPRSEPVRLAGDRREIRCGNVLHQRNHRTS